MKVCYFLMAGLLVSGLSQAASATPSMGNVEQMVVCLTPPSATTLTQAEFNKVYPHLAEYTFEKRKLGLIKDAYFVGNIMDGAVLIVLGKNADDARVNGKKVADDLVNVFKDQKVNKGQCTLAAKMM